MNFLKKIIQSNNKIITFFRTLIQRIIKHDVNSYSAKCAYYLLLGIFPFIILLIMFITALGASQIDNIDKFLELFPGGTSNIVKDYLVYSSQFKTDMFSPLLITTILLSSGAISALITAFNIANDNKNTRNFIVDQIISILFLVFIVSVVTISLSISALGLPIINSIFTKIKLPPIDAYTFNIITNIINFIIYTFIIGLMYYILPCKKTTFKHIVPGTVFAASSIVISVYLFGHIVKNYTKYSLVYGSLSSIIILLIWLFLCSFILIIGEEINAICQK